MLSLSLAARAAAQDQRPPDEAKPSTQEPVAGDSYGPKSANPTAQRRIVDPKKFPPKENPIGRFFMAPFRMMEPGIRRGMTTLEESNMFERVAVYYRNTFHGDEPPPPGEVRDHRHLHIQPSFGSLGDGSGFGVGARLTTADLLSPNFMPFIAAHGTMKRYLHAETGFELDPTGNSRRDFTIEATGRLRIRPQDDFWGIGPDTTRAIRSSYELRETGGSILAALHPWGKHFRFGVGMDYSSASISGGDEEENVVPTTVAFPVVPGINGADLLGGIAFIEFDGRDSIGIPRNGMLARFAVTSNDSVGRGDFGFTQYRLNVETYVPLWSKRRVVSVRMLGDFNDPKGGSQIPFYRLARLGDSETLRGFDTWRFHGNNALAWNLDYRFAVAPGVDVLAFYDIGQVYDRTDQVSWEAMRRTAGGGFQFRTAKAIVFRLLVGTSTEGQRVLLSFSPSF
jgi:hypothetical protein